jgi:uncharacterized integral membrane protein
MRWTWLAWCCILLLLLLLLLLLWEGVRRCNLPL